MAQIELTKGRVAFIDDDKFHYINQWKWHYSNGYAVRKCYALGRKGVKIIRMHRLIIGLYERATNVFVDHINGDKLDNRLLNLRICSKGENGRNQSKYRNNKSGFKGVYYQRDIKKFRAQGTLNGRAYYIGVFETAAEAKKAFDRWAKRQHGEFYHI